jgi:hypothetical protein
MDRRSLFQSAAALLLTPFIKANIVSPENGRLLSAKARKVSGFLQYGESLKPFPEYPGGYGSDLGSCKDLALCTHESLPHTSFNEEGQWVIKTLDSPTSLLNFYNYVGQEPYETIVYVVSPLGVYDFYSGLSSYILFVNTEELNLVL